MTQALRIIRVDAFTSTPLEGNPCVVVLDADDLTDEQMLAIAREMNLSETAFVLEPQTTDVRARYFTPAAEIPLAGHPTLATIAALVHTRSIKPGRRKKSISLELPAGVVELELERNVGFVHVTMSQLAPKFDEPLTHEEVLPAFGLSARDAMPGTRPQVVSTGTRQLMVPLRNLEALKRAKPDQKRLHALLERTRAFGPHLFCKGGFSSAGDTAARHFGLPPDLLEDPFTGSATGGMASYLWRHGLIRKPTFLAEQGWPQGRPGIANVELVGQRENIETVRVGGDAVVVEDGTLNVPGRSSRWKQQSRRLA